MSFRTEEKIISPLTEIDKLKFHIFNNGGKELYPKRKILSIYFDNSKLKMFLDSEEGCVPRKKIRVRSYPDSKMEEGFNLEKKISSVEGRFKKSKKITQKEFNNICKKGLYDMDYGNCLPIIWVEYFREYYSLKNQRVTLDSEIKFKNFQSNVVNQDYDNLICEIKGDKNFNKDFFENVLPFSRSRFSKYAFGIKKLSSANLTD